MDIIPKWTFCPVGIFSAFNPGCGISRCSMNHYFPKVDDKQIIPFIIQQVLMYVDTQLFIHQGL
jgi:hypothetical protein